MPDQIAGAAVERVLAALDTAGCRTYSRSGKHRAQCPVHKSRGLTLSIRQGHKGAMITCFAGCELTELASALELTMREFFDADLPPGYTPPPRRVATPWDVITQGPGVDHLLHRIAQNAAAEGNPEYWDRRALAFENATTRTMGLRSNAAVQHDAELVDLANACRNRAALIRVESAK